MEFYSEDVRMRRWLLALLISLLFCCAGAAESAEYQDGVYRGFYYQDGMEQVAVQFELKDGVFKSLVLRKLKNQNGSFMDEQAEAWKKNALTHFTVLCNYLVGKEADAIHELYAPAEILAQAGLEMSEHIHYPKLVSALWDALSRRPYKLVDTSKLPEAEPYPDGMYTGVYSDDDGEQVVLDFTVRDNTITQISYRKLAYKGIDYLSEEASVAVQQVAGQFGQLIEYLVDKDLTAVNDLYQPDQIAQDTDISSAATLRAPKIISAIWEGLNKNAYSTVE